MKEAMAELFCLSDEQWQPIAPLTHTNHPGARRKDHHTVLSSILHVIIAAVAGRIV